jgi:hypothetical protein
VSVKGQQKRLGHSPQAFHLAEEWRVTLSGYNLDLLHSCPSAFADCLSSHGAWILYETRFYLSSDLATLFAAISLLFLRLLPALFTNAIFLGAL